MSNEINSAAIVANPMLAAGCLSADEHKPEINHSDQWDVEHKISVRVVVFIEGYSPMFGRYYFNEHYPHWTVEGVSGFDQSKVKYWMPVPLWS